MLEGIFAACSDARLSWDQRCVQTTAAAALAPIWCETVHSVRVSTLNPAMTVWRRVCEYEDTLDIAHLTEDDEQM